VLGAGERGEPVFAFGLVLGLVGLASRLLDRLSVLPPQPAR
jgi:hypothetical protein